MTVNFSASPLTVCVGQPVQFTDLTNSANPIVSWAWDFGDGTSSNIQNPSHTYATAGNFTVILTASNGINAVSEVKANYILVNPLPQPSFTLSTPPCILPANLSVTSVSPPNGMSYNWNFGNGQTSTQALPSNISYSTAGSYTINLTTTNTLTGCSNSTSQNININNYSTSFSSSTTTVCTGNPVTFTQTCPPGTNQFNWNFGNGQTSNQPNPAIQFNSAGTYTVTLNSQNTTLGCSGQATQTITVIAAQQPSLTPSLTIGCNPQTISFNNTSGFNGTFSWNFGNGNTFSGTNPPPQSYSMPDYDVFPFPESQSFSVTITSLDANGCASSQHYPNLITIYNIFPEFSMNVDEGCETLLVSFSNTSYSPIPGFPINSWSWNFGNGQTSNQQNPPTQAFNLGVYNVSLTITTANGCTEILDSIQAIQVGIPPLVNFTVGPDTICARQNLTFVNLSEITVPHQPDEVSYQWFIGSQGPFSDFEPNSQPVLDTGAIDIMLVVDFRGCKDTLLLQEIIYVWGPLVNFTMPQVLCNPDIPVQISVQDQTILGQENDQVAVFWWLGDGTTHNYNTSPLAWQNNQTTFPHTYNTYGDYVIKQKAWNYTNGCIDSLQKIIYVNSFDVTLNVLNDSVCFESASLFNFTHQSMVNHGVSTFNYYANDFFMGHSHLMQVSNPDDYIFPNAGVNQIVLNAINGLGCPASDTLALYVAPWPQVSIDLINVVGCVPTQATFQDASTSLSGVAFVNYEWTTSGPAISPNGNPTFTSSVPQAGNYTTNLTVTDALGCSNSGTLITNFVTPVANFDVPEVVCNNTPFSPINLSQNYSNSFWYWNNQLISSENNPEITLNLPVDPNVLSYNETLKLVVSDGFGCTSEIEVPFVVSSPNANYSYLLTGANTDEFGNFSCPSVFGQFTDLSESYGDIVGWNWVFGDGKTSIFQNPSNTYVFAGTYTSSLTITDEFGCQSSITFNNFLTINGPSGVFGWVNGGTACDPNIMFEVYQTNNVTQIQWFPGNGTSFSSLTGGEYLYPAAGTFAPFLIISDDNNCTVTYPLDTITIQFGNLNAAFEVSPTTLNWGENLNVNNLSTGGIGGIVSNSWTFGNHNFVNNQNQFNYLFNDAGNINIMLIVTDAQGCTDTAYASVFVTTELAFPNVFSPNGDGTNDMFTFIFNAYREYEVTILNRWGNVMGQRYIIDDNYLWDGLAPNGKPAAEGVYYYIVKGILRDNTPREDYGFFHLILK